MRHRTRTDTAASVWLTAAQSMACGAGLPVLAVATMVIHFVVMFAFPRLVEYLPREKRTTTRLRISYQAGHGLLRDILIACTQPRFAIGHVNVEQDRAVAEGAEEAQELADLERAEAEGSKKGVVSLTMQLKGWSAPLRVDKLAELV